LIRDPQHMGTGDVPTDDRAALARRSSIAYIGLGANLGERLPALCQACLRLDKLGTIKVISSIYETEPVGFADQPSFLNAVISLETEREPGQLMSGLLRIEHELGRVRTFPNAPRAIDLDLLFYDDAVIERSDLVVPHPRLHERAFVLVPLNEIGPDLVHPQLKASVGDLLQRLGPITGIRRASVSLVNTVGNT